MYLHVMVHLDSLIYVAKFFLRDFFGTSHDFGFDLCRLIISYPLSIPTRRCFHQATLVVHDLVTFNLTEKALRVDHPCRLWGSPLLERIFIVQHKGGKCPLFRRGIQGFGI